MINKQTVRNGILALLFLILFPLFDLYATETSYEIFIKKSLIDSFLIREADGKATTSSVAIDLPDTYSIPISIADVYLSTEQQYVSFQISSANSFEMKNASGAAIPYELYAQTEISTDLISITGTSSSFLAKEETTPYEDAYVFSLMVLLDEDACNSAVSGEYSDTLQLIMVVE